MHRAEVVSIDGDSYRAKEAEEREAQRQAERSAKTAASRAQGRKISAAPIPAAPTTRTTTTAAAPIVPLHWTPAQALAVFEFLQVVREAIWLQYGPQVQQAWSDQLVPDGPPPDFDPDEPF